MRTNLFKFILFAACIVLPTNLLAQQGETEKEKPLAFWDVRKTLVFRSQKRESDAEINEHLIKEIRRRKANFILSDDDEKYIKKFGGSDLLIKTIYENAPKGLEEQFALYKKFADNYKYDGKQRSLAIEAAREYVKKFGSDDKEKELVEWFKNWLLQATARM